MQKISSMRIMCSNGHSGYERVCKCRFQRACTLHMGKHVPTGSTGWFFEEETGIKVVYSNFDTDENMLEKLSMAKGGDYDVVVADDYIIETAIQEGLVEKLDTSKLSGWDNINPLYQGQFYDPNDEYTAPYGAGIPLIVYDPDMVDIDIKGYNDLWDPSLEDSIALTANYRVINGITNLVLGQDFNDQDTDDIAKQVRNFWSLHRMFV